MEISNAIEGLNKQRLFFDSGATRPYSFRITQLKKLLKALNDFEKEILSALKADLNKHEMEAYASEIGLLKLEIKHTLKNLAEWMETEYVPTPLFHWPSSSFIQKDPLGVVLIIGPWNYPFMLLIGPLISALAAGNCACLKPSNQAPQTAFVTEKLIHLIFPEDLVSVVQGSGSSVGPELIQKFRFDHIFFTGSVEIGKQIMRMAADELVPVTLELGGKSPCVIDENIPIKIAAKRVVWSKFWNAGQTCVGPDYLLINENIADNFVLELIHEIKELFGANPERSDSYGRIINDKRFEKLLTFLKEGNILNGGESNKSTRYLSPTLIENLPAKATVMQEEIFGPILPIFRYKTNDEALAFIKKHPFPLSFYLYTKNKKTEKFFLENLAFGGGGINIALGHLANPDLPFGGIGYSGLGSYHGKYGFDTFTHRKSMMKTPFFPDVFVRYQPFRNKLKWIKWFMG
jgi:aldehyde dehydrogenase (NAD+)